MTTSILAKQADITTLSIDAIVNAANSSLGGGGSMAQSIVPQAPTWGLNVVC
jgi:O-acetyl-ADP-ribose deacetylase (regulator of RNase III)